MPSSPLDQLLDGPQPGMEEQQVPDHEPAVGVLGGLDELARLGDRERERLLDEEVLAGGEHAHAERMVGRHRGRDRDTVDGVVGEHLVEVGGHARLGVQLAVAAQVVVGEVAGPGELADASEVASEVRAPVAQADDRQPQGARHRRITLSSAPGTRRVALRKSTTIGASSTTRA